MLAHSVAVKKYSNKIFERVETSAPATKEKSVLPESPKKVETRTDNHLGEIDEAQDLLSDSNSSSMGSSSHQSQSQDLYDNDSIREQLNGKGKAVPVLIKRLIFVLVVFLIVVVSLVSVETTELYSLTTDLSDRFTMIRYHNIRYELVIYLCASPTTYDMYRREENTENFSDYCYRTTQRVNKALDYNYKVTKSFTQFGLEYDYNDIILNSDSGSYLAAFDYAFFKVHPRSPRCST